MNSSKKPQSRADASRRRRSEASHARQDSARNHVRKIPRAPTLSRTRPTASRPAARSKARRRYQVSVPFGGKASLSLPSLHIQAGPRAISAAIILVMLGALALLWYVPPFVVQSAEVRGAQRLGASDINSVLDLTGEPLVTVDTAELEETLRAAFPEIKDVSVHIGFPAGLVVSLSERAPLIAWQQGSETLWVDADGIAFPPRGTAEGLIVVQVSGETPPDEATATSAGNVTGLPELSLLFPEEAPAVSARQVLTPDSVTALQAIGPYVPEGSALIYDRSYGLGWTDTRGWQAYFGHSTSDLSLKLDMYQSLVDSLASRAIQPSMISVEFPDAPFYRVEQ